MLSDVSNRALAPPARQGAGPSSAVANNKRPLDHHSSEGDAAQPAKLPYRRDLGTCSLDAYPDRARSPPRSRTCSVNVVLVVPSRRILVLALLPAQQG